MFKYGYKLIIQTLKTITCETFVGFDKTIVFNQKVDCYYQKIKLIKSKVNMIVQYKGC